jgi:hypothetical protein
VDLHAKAWVLAFQDSGHKVRFEEVRKQIGKGGDQLMPVFLSKEEIERIEKALEACRGAIPAHCPKSSQSSCLIEASIAVAQAA